MSPIFNFFGYSFGAYHVFVILAIFVFVLCVYLGCKVCKFPQFDFFFFICLIITCGFAGSKLFYLFEGIEVFEFWEINGSWVNKIFNFHSGFVLYGGVVFVFGSSYFYTKHIKISFFSLSDILSIAMNLSIAIGKLGCLFAGCCYGIPSPIQGIGIIYNNSLYKTVPQNIFIFPIQLFDCLFSFVLFVLFSILKFKYRISNGSIFILFLVLYPCYRIVSEIFRADISRGFFFQSSISLSQFYSILTLIFVAFYLKISKHKKSNENFYSR